MLNYFFKVPFALAGDKAAIPQATQPDGSLSFNQGFGPDYELPYSNPDSKDIPRDMSNQLQYLITTALQEYQQNGVPDWIDPSQNGGVNFAYPIFARVRYGGSLWFSAVAANNGTPGVSANWVKVAGSFMGMRVISTVGANAYTSSPGTQTTIFVGSGAGGGGGGIPGPSTTSGGGGGAAGASGLVVAQGSLSLTITIGAGGTVAAGAAGAAGGATSVGALMTCPGGPGGSLGINNTGAGVSGPGSASSGPPTGTGVIGKSGTVGAPGFAISASSVLSGAGGSNWLATGAAGGAANGTQVVNGNTGGGYGAGGGGAIGINNGVAGSGGAGSQGIVLAFEFGGA